MMIGSVCMIFSWVCIYLGIEGRRSVKALNRPRADIRFSFEKEILVPAGTVGWRGPELDSWEEIMATVKERDVVDPAS